MNKENDLLKMVIYWFSWLVGSFIIMRPVLEYKFSPYDLQNLDAINHSSTVLMFWFLVFTLIFYSLFEAMLKDRWLK